MVDGKRRRTDAAARVRALLAVARRIADPGDSLGVCARARLCELSDLSLSGVELALSRHLETTASDLELATFIERAEESARCAVVLSGNVCTAALRALAFGLATASSVLVKPSRRDPVLAELLAAELPTLEVVRSVEEALDRLQTGDELHVYGSEATVAAIEPRATARGLTLRSHGSGFGVAAIEADDAIESATVALATALVPFDGRGCLSPRLAFVAGGRARGRAFADSLNGALSKLALTVPRGTLSTLERGELSRFANAYQLLGEVWQHQDHLVAFDPFPEALSLAPAHRGVCVLAAEAAVAAHLLTPFSRRVTAIGQVGNRPGPLAHALAQTSPFARLGRLENMQRPPFDGPVDLRNILAQSAGTKTRSR